MIGERLGLYDAMTEAGPVTSQELARLTGTYERYVREWLLNQAAGGYVEYDAASGRYTLPAEHAALLSIVCAGYRTYLAQAYPRSRFVGIDNHAASIEVARRAAAEAGVADRATFEVASATEYSAPLAGYDLIAFFDSLHDLGDPIESVRHARETLATDGTVMFVDPLAGERVEENLTPLGRALSGASTMLCTPHSRSTNGVALGALASEARIREVVMAGGLEQLRRATETPFNRIFEARR